MKLIGLLFVLILSVLVATQALGALAPVEPDAPPVIPAASEMPQIRLVHAQPFTLEVPYRHDWCAERPEVREGYLVVLATDRELLIRRQTAEPVIHCGNATVERVNNGGESGHLVAFVPVLDLLGRPFFFGAPELPERMDSERSEHELASFSRGGGSAPSDVTLREALVTGGDRLVLRDREELERAAARLVRAYAPEDAHVADRLER